MSTAGTVFRKLRHFAAVAVFLAMMVVGYFSLSVTTSCPARAQTCLCSICVMQGPGSVSVTLGLMTAQVQAQIAAATAAIITNYSLEISAFSLRVVAHFMQVIEDFDDWFDTFWYYNQKPSLQAMTEQANVMANQQAMAISNFRDAMELGRNSQMRTELEFQGARANAVSQSACIAGSVAGGMARANNIARAYGRAAPAERLPRSTNSRGTAAEKGPLNDTRERFDQYVARYCDASDNNGAAGCAADSPYRNWDIDVNYMVFSRDTIPLTDPAVRQATDDLVKNIAEPFVPDLIPQAMLNTATGNQAMLARNANQAKRQAIHTALYYTIARRAPGGGDAATQAAGGTSSGMTAQSSGSFVAAVRQAAGLTPDMISSNPSHNEIMEAMMNERFRTGNYTVDQIDTPDNNDRELVIQNAFQVMQMHDQLDLLDRYGMMVASEVALEINEARQSDSVSRARGNK